MRFLLVLLSASLWLAVTRSFAGEAAGAGSVPATVNPSAAHASTARDVAAVRMAEQQRAQAIAGRDIASLRKLISGDYHHVESTGRTRTKTEFLQLLARGEYEWRSYDLQDMEIRMFDQGRAALVMGRFRAEVDASARARELRGRYVRLWVLGPDGWRNTMQQSTEIRPPAAVRESRARP